MRPLFVSSNFLYNNFLAVFPIGVVARKNNVRIALSYLFERVRYFKLILHAFTAVGPDGIFYSLVYSVYLIGYVVFL